MTISIGSIAYDHRQEPTPPAAPVPDCVSEAAQRLTRSLQAYLHVDPLLARFDAELRTVVPHDGLHYTNTEHDVLVAPPVTARHRCTYRLFVEDQALGEISFQRGRPFSDEDMRHTEHLLACLGYPLRNALMYRAATRAALMDLLTGAQNRTAFDRALPCEVARAARHDQPLSLIVYDVDHFKSRNDRYGHQGGDHILRCVTQCVLDKVRTSDTLYRYGGDEFVLILPSTPPRGALALAERIRAAVAAGGWEWEGTPMPVTISVGVAHLRAGEDAAALFAAGDAALYAAKEAGRNCVRARMGHSAEA